jgi:hypothetical protein
MIFSPDSPADAFLAQPGCTVDAVNLWTDFAPDLCTTFAQRSQWSEVGA